MKLSACLLFAIVGFPAACVTGDSFRNSIRIGMDRKEVIDHLGEPDGVRAEGNCEALTYANRLISGWNWDRLTTSWSCGMARWSSTDQAPSGKT